MRSEKSHLNPGARLQAAFGTNMRNTGRLRAARRKRRAAPCANSEPPLPIKVLATGGLAHERSARLGRAVNALGMVISRAAAIVPLTLLSLALAVVAFVAIIRPTKERLAMVDRVGRAIKDLGAVAAGSADRLHSMDSLPSGKGGPPTTTAGHAEAVPPAER